MTALMWIGLLLSVWGAIGMLVAGRGRWQGWAMSLAAQPIWVLFALEAHAWTLIFSSVLYGTVASRNLWRWRNGVPA